MTIRSVTAGSMPIRVAMRRPHSPVAREWMHVASSRTLSIASKLSIAATGDSSRAPPAGARSRSLRRVRVLTTSRNTRIEARSPSSAWASSSTASHTVSIAEATTAAECAWRTMRDQ